LLAQAARRRLRLLPAEPGQRLDPPEQLTGIGYAGPDRCGIVSVRVGRWLGTALRTLGHRPPETGGGRGLGEDRGEVDRVVVGDRAASSWGTPRRSANRYGPTNAFPTGILLIEQHADQKG